MPSPRLCLPGLFVLASCSSGSSGPEPVPVRISAMQWAFVPSAVTLQKGTPVELELTSSDVHHRFYLPDFDIDVDLVPGQSTSVQLTPTSAGTFPFRCEYYCGQGHEGMVGHVVVE